MWKWLNRMLDEMRVSSNVDSLPAGIELPVCAVRLKSWQIQLKNWASALFSLMET